MRFVAAMALVTAAASVAGAQQGEELAVQRVWPQEQESWRYERIAGAGHWMMLDKPEEVNRLLVDFLKGQPPTR